MATKTFDARAIDAALNSKVSGDSQAALKKAAAELLAEMGEFFEGRLDPCAGLPCPFNCGESYEMLDYRLKKFQAALDKLAPHL